MKRRPFNPFLSQITALTALLASVNSASAIDYYWNQNSTTAGWGLGGAWSTSSAVFTAAPEDALGTAVTATTGTADALFIGSATTGFTGGTLTLTGTQSIGSIITGSANTTAGVVISGGTLDFAASGIVTNNSSQNITIDSVITGAATRLDLNDSGGGTITMSGSANTYGGITFINSGTVITNNAASLGASGSDANRTVVASGARLSFNNASRTYTERFEIAGAGVGGTTGALTNNQTGTILNGQVSLSGAATVHSGGGSLIFGGGILLGGNALTFRVDSGTQTVQTTGISNGSVIKSGAGTLNLNVNSAFAGGLTIRAGTVATATATSQGAGSVTIGDSGNTGASATWQSSSANNTYTSAISTTGTGTNSIAVFGFNPIYQGAITLGSNLTIFSNNSFGSTISSTGGVSGTGNLTIQSNAANGSNNSAITFSGTTLNFTGSITNSGTTTSTAASHTTISAVIGTNVTGVTQNSTNSNLILTGANSFTSNILVSAGTLQANLASASANPVTGALGNAQALGRTATINTGATLRFGVSNVLGNGGSTPNLTLIANGGTILHVVNGDINSIGPVQLNGGNLSSTGTGTGGFKLTGTVTVGGSALSTISASGIIGSSGVITYDVGDAVAGSGNDLNVTAVVADIFGAGGIIKTGAGTMTLTNVNTFTGGTRIDNGTLALGNATNTLVGAVNVNGGSLALGTNTDTVGAVTLTSGSITGSGTGALTGSSYDMRSGSVSAILGGASVALTKSTAGTVSLTGVNTYSGATNITGGTLAVNGAGSINNSAVTINGGTLRYNSSTPYSGAFTFTSGTIGGTNLTGSLNNLTISSSQTLSPGNSPGTSSTGSQTWASGGTYAWEINNATATAGADPGWDLLAGTGTLTITATSGSQFNLNLFSLLTTPVDTAGALTNFNNALSYNWLIADFNNAVVGYAANAFNINATNFTNNNTINGAFAVALGNTVSGGDNTQLYLTYTAIPEPRTALLGALGLLALLRRRRN